MILPTGQKMHLLGLFCIKINRIMSGNITFNQSCCVKIVVNEAAAPLI